MLRPVPRPRTKTDEKTLRGRPVWIDETGYVTGEKGSRYSEVSTTIPWGTDWITAPSVDENGSKLSDDEVFRKLKDNQGRDFITGEKLPTFQSEPEATAYAKWRSDTMFDEEQIEKGYKPVLEQQQYEEDVEETLTDKLIRKAKPFTDEVKGFADYLMTPSQHFDEGGLATQTEEAFNYRKRLSDMTPEERQRVAPSADNFKNLYSDRSKKPLSVKAIEGATSLTPLDSIVEISKELKKEEPDYKKIGLLTAMEAAGAVAPMAKPAMTAIKAGKKGNTVRAYKLFTKDKDGKLYPLFVDADAEVPIGKNLKATFPEYRFKAKNNNFYVPSRGTAGAKGTGDSIEIPNKKTRDMLIEAGFLPKGSKAKTIKAVAARPGWHAGDLPTAPHIGPEIKVDGKTYKIRGDNQVWAEVEMPNDVDWQIIANSRASIVKSGENKGKLNVKTAHITDELPFGGYYRYKTNPKMEGEWLISGDMKVIRELDKDEVKQINKAAGRKDLPTLKELKEELGFASGGIVGDNMYKGMDDYLMSEMDIGMSKGGEVDAIDPVSGNEIPPGSTAKEVRDDIPAMLSEGEYVVPADVLKFYGLRFFEDLRQKAKVEMAMLEEDGRMGGQPTPEGDDLTEDEMRLLDEVMGMAQGGMTQMQPQQPQPPQPMMMGQQMPPPKPQPTEYNKPVGFNTGGMTDAFGNPIGPTVEPAKTPDKFLEDIDPTSTNVYGIDKEGTGTGSSTDLAQEDIGVKTPTDQVGTGDGSGMKTVFYFHEDGRRIQVLMLNGRPISSVPADFSEFKEDTPENRTPDPTPEDPTDDLGGGVGETKSAGGGGSDDDERRVQAKTIETLKTNAEKKRIETFNNTLATGKPEDILEEYKKAKRGQGASFLLPGLVGVASAGLAKKNLNTIEAAYLKRSKDILGDAFNLEEAQKTLDDISIGSATMEGVTGTFEGKDGETAMSNLFGKGFYDNYEAKYDVSEYIGMGSSISGVGVKGFVKDGYGNLDARQQQHFDNAVDRGDSAILNHFSLVATSNRAKDQFAIDNADAIQNIQALEAAGDKAGAKAAADKLKNSGYKFGNMNLGNSSMDEAIKLGSSADTAKKLGKAKKEKGFFSKTVPVEDDNGKKNNSPIRTTEPVKDDGPTAAEKVAEAAAKKKAADDAAKAKRAEDFRKKENRRAESQGGGDFHSNMVAKAQERQKQTRAGQQAGKGYVGGFGFDKGGLMKRKK